VAAACAACVALPTAPAVLCVAGVAVSLAALLGRLLHRSRWSVLGLELSADGSAAWQDRDRKWHPATGLVGVALAPWLVVLAVRDEAGRSRNVLVLPDTVDSGALRRLRLWLRWRPVPAASAGGRGQSVKAVKNP
jgi:hypothetical protein